MLEKLKHITSQILNIGINENYSIVQKIRIRITNILGIMFLIFSIGRTIIIVAVGLTDLFLFAFLFIVIPILILYTNSKKHFKTARLFLILICLMIVSLNYILIDFDTDSNIFILFLIILVWVFFEPKDKMIIIFNLIVLMGFYLVVEFNLWQRPTFLIDSITYDQAMFLKYQIFVIVLVLISIFMYAITMIFSDTYNQLHQSLSVKEQLIKEKQKSNEHLAGSLEELEQLAYASTNDLKDPLRGIINFTQLFRYKFAKDLNDESQGYLDYIENEGKRQFQQIDDLMNYLRVGIQEEEIEIVDVGVIVNEIINSLKGITEEKQITIEIFDLPEVVCNTSDLKQVLYNLISNAVKFSTQSNKISIVNISAKEESNHFLFSVEDNGAGFEMKFHDRIFGIFKTLSVDDRQKGSGIGLSVCKKIVEKYNGEIWAESTLGIGSTFYFTIPKVDNKSIFLK